MDTIDTQTPNTYYVDTFGGYNANIRVSENEFNDMRNMTGDYYPLLSPRNKRGMTPFSGIYSMLPCDTSGTREGLSQGGICAVTKENGETLMRFFKADGTSAKAPYSVGGDPEETTLIQQAGYVYAFPQAVRFGTVKTEREKLSNETSVRKNPAVSDVYSRVACFTMQPCDREGILDDSPLSTFTLTSVYDGTGTFTRPSDSLVAVTGGTPPVNQWGVTVYIGSDGIVTSIKSYVAETITVPSGGFVLTGHGKGAYWLSSYAAVGRYITRTGSAVKIYENAASAEVVTVKPDNPANGLRWRDNITGKLYVYSSAVGQWVAQTQNYIMLSFGDTDYEDGGEYAYIGERNGVRQKDEQGNYTLEPFEGFKVGDAITISGISKKYDSTYVIASIAAHGLILNGFIDEKITRYISADRTVTISRKVPHMDFVVECNNRLWGCYYGHKDKDDPSSEVLNEIYCSALGDPTNWYKYEGTAMDSWTASVGEPGAWTGAAVYGGYPIFFKENAIIRIYGTAPSSFQTAAYNYRGVKANSHRSLAIVDEVLFYHSCDGFVAYTGGVPTKIDSALGHAVYSDAVGGSFGSKYYVSAKCGGKYSVLVYDTSTGLWHKEDDMKVRQFCRVSDKLYIVRDDLSVITSGGGTDEKVDWFAQTGVIGYGDIYYKRLTKVNIKLKLPLGSEFTVYASYDDGSWETCGTYTGMDDMPIDISFIPMRCDRFRIRYEGRGDCKIISTYAETEYAG